MVVRGAPAIGQVAAIGLALSARSGRGTRCRYARRAIIRGAAAALRASRPTAVNLGWAVDRMMARYEAVGELDDDGEDDRRRAPRRGRRDRRRGDDDHGRLAEFGLAVLPRQGLRAAPDPDPLQHRAARLRPVRDGARRSSRPPTTPAARSSVWVDETRPYLQGARLTAWELEQAGVPHTLIPDVAAGSLMRRGEVDVVIVGADRVAANGDTANKVGTYPLAVLAARHGIPFFVCAPTSLDRPRRRRTATAIEIEERAGRRGAR